MRALMTITLVAALVAVGCGGDTDETAAVGDGDLSVVAAFYPLAWAAAEVGSDAVTVTDLTPPGAEAHDLELTPDQRDAIEDADLVVVMGNGFQPAVEDAAGQRDGTTLVVFDALDSVETEGRLVEDAHDEDEEGAHEDEGAETDDDHTDEEDATGEADDHDDEGDTSDGLDPLDPHVWLDPVLMSEVVDAIEVALVDVAPDDSQVFEDNAGTLRDELAALDAEFEAALATCESRTLVTGHDAFGYLAARYDLEPHGVAGISPDAEPDPARLAELADLVEDEGVTVVFTEEYLAPDIAETLASEAGVDTDVLHTLETLDDESRDAGDDYLAVMRTNLIRISDALRCPPSQ